MCEQARIIKKFAATLTASEWRQVAGLHGTLNKSMQDNLRASRSVQQCDGINDVVLELQDERAMLVKLMQLLNVMVAYGR